MGGPADGGRIAFAFPEAVPGLRILRGEDSTHLWHVLNDVYAVSTPPRSAAEFRFRGQTGQVSADTVLLLDPGEVFQVTRMPFPEQCRCLHIAPSLIETAARELGIRGGRVQFKEVLVRHPRFFELALRLHRAIETETTALEQQSLFTRCVHHLLEELVEVGARRVRVSAEHAAVRRTKELLDARFSENISLDELAHVGGISRFHMLRTFSAAVGLPPHAYQNRLRVNHAAQLLAAGMPPAYVAGRVAPGSYLPRAPTDPDVRSYRIRLFEAWIRYGEASECTSRASGSG